jgi:(p)ppGpp synthase/HD superfamily hydrolase
MKKFSKRQDNLLEFVKLAHEGQVRKYSNEPYWKHPLAVARILAKFKVEYPLLLEVALCHDILEDTDVKLGQLIRGVLACGYGIAEATYITDGVVALTDVYTSEAYPEKNRKERKALELGRISKMRPEYQSVKYADILHNMTPIIQNDPLFAKVYLAEKRDILSTIRMGDFGLFCRCCSILSINKT